LSADGEGGFFAMIFFSAPTRVGRGTGFTSKCFPRRLATNHRGATALPLQNSLPLPAPAFEDRGVPTGIAPSPERFETKPEQKSDYNYS
jgi:hypothetical protein